MASKATQPVNAGGETFAEWSKEAEKQLRGLGWTVTGIFYGLIWGGSKDAWMADVAPHEWARRVMEESPAELGLGHLREKTQVLTWPAAEVNPGPWQGFDGLYFEVSGKTFGPYSTEDAAEDAFDIELRR